MRSRAPFFEENDDGIGHDVLPIDLAPMPDRHNLYRFLGIIDRVEHTIVSYTQAVFPSMRKTFHPWWTWIVFKG